MKDEGAISISTSPYFLNVTELHLCYNALTDAAITAICESRQLTNIQTLKLGCSLSHTKNVVSVLSSSQNMKNLKALNISNVDIYNIDDLAQSDIMNNLTEIDLSDCAMNDEDVVSISKSVVMKNLRTLVLDFNVITYHGVHSLSTSPNLINLTKLHLANNSLGDDGAKAIAGGFSMLTYLDLSGCDIGNEGLKSISNSTTLTKLRTLNLNFSKVIQEWKVIGNSNNLSKLNRLYLANNDTLTIRNVVSIVKHMKRLVELNVQRCNSPFSDETMQVLCEMFPACDLSW
ncbi:hypothetical protein C9374_013934 [Naegleria lovaniensis]|uniref:F-box/LRR-repeat protein 15-like leucin rich repeat domain-containing protein n=1 Tax=Naegleria lovaniensis TaxID=51637 RepID=A0AA88H172_NAELO|nr:uncharacterized protein C9374_013934 [Naegleria lovaniensis]KAG2389374.1 hypothetical protein C9374_013934 [Naegleria lovaniensis]